MMHRTAVLLGFALILAAPAWAGWKASSGVAAWYDGDLPVSSFRLAPTFALDGTRGVVVGGAMMSGSQMRAPYRAARLASGWVFDPIQRLPLELRMSVSHRGGPTEPARGLVRTEGRLNFSAPAMGGYMALATERAFGLTGQLGDRPLVGFGTWTRHKGVLLSFDLEQRAGLLPQVVRGREPAPPDTGRSVVPTSEGMVATARNQLRRVALTTTRASLYWQADRLEIESVAGVTLRLVREPKRWAQATAAYAVAPNMAAFATFGSRDPELYLIEPAETPRATFGLRLSHWRSAVLDAPLVARAAATRWHARRMDDQSWTFEVRAPGARLVEVMGDFTRWEPLQLEHVSGDRWATTVMLEPGVHQVNLRVDGGAWMAPPGAPTSADGYGGTTGVVVAE